MIDPNKMMAAFDATDSRLREVYAENRALQDKLTTLLEAAEAAIPYVDDDTWRKELRAAVKKAREGL